MRVLFVAESVTLAQVVRLVALARRLDPDVFEVHFASARFDEIAFANTSFQHWNLDGSHISHAVEALNKGRRLYEAAVLKRYVREELELLDKVRPAFIVGDFRLSLAISAQLAEIPCATLINAYWSPHAQRTNFPVPDHPIVQLVGVETATRYFPKAMPRVFAHFLAPINETRTAFGLAPVESLFHALTAGDFVLHPDVPELCPTAGAPAHHLYLGHIPWSPDVAEDPAWSELGTRRPLIYVTLGSSGTLSALPAVLQAVERLPVDVLLSTAGRDRPKRVPPNVVVADFVPGARIVERAALAVTNGGSTSGYQALAAGVPVVGVPFNLDQYLTMTAIEAHGGGILVRSGTATAERVLTAVGAALSDGHYRKAAEKLQAALAALDCHSQFEALLRSLQPAATRPHTPRQAQSGAP